MPFAWSVAVCALLAARAHVGVRAVHFEGLWGVRCVWRWDSGEGERERESQQVAGPLPRL